MNFLLNIVLLMLCLLKTNSDVITAPTFYECEPKAVPYSSGHCIDDCKGVFQLSNPVEVTLFKSSVLENVMIGTCKHVERKTEITQTWTLSKLPPQISRKFMPVSKDGCLFHWNKECNNQECSTKEPAISNDYSWASTKTYVDNYWLIDVSRRATLLNIGGTTNLMTKRGLVEYSEGYSASEDRTSAEIWTPDSTRPHICSLVAEKKINCYNTTKPEVLLCPKLGLELNMKEQIVHDGCMMPYFFDETFIFQINAQVEVSTPSGHQVGGDLDLIWMMINSMKVKIEYQESLECFSRCMSINNMKEGGVVSVFGKIMKKVSGGNFTSCHVEPTCQIHIPLIKCKGSELIQVTCSNHMRWWNHTDGMELGEDTCIPGESTFNETIISSGHENIVINSSGYFWEPSSLSPHERLEILDHHSVIKLSNMVGRDHVVKGSNHTAFSYGGSSEVNRDWVEFSLEWFSSFYHHVLLFFALVAVVMLVGIWLYGRRYRTFALLQDNSTGPNPPPPRANVEDTRYVHE